MGVQGFWFMVYKGEGSGFTGLGFQGLGFILTDPPRTSTPPWQHCLTIPRAS